LARGPRASPSTCGPHPSDGHDRDTSPVSVTDSDEPIRSADFRPVRGLVWLRIGGDWFSAAEQDPAGGPLAGLVAPVGPPARRAELRRPAAIEERRRLRAAAHELRAERPHGADDADERHAPAVHHRPGEPPPAPLALLAV